MKSILGLFLLIMLSTIGIVPAYPQTAEKIPRIGLLVPWTTPIEDDRKRDLDAFLLGLKEQGYVDGKNILIESRFADAKANQLRRQADELVRFNLAVLVASGTTAISSALKATKNIPIVMLSGGNPVSRGFVKSLSQPGGNVTGFSSSVEGDEVKRLELLKETFPGISRVVVLNADKSKRRAQTYAKEGKALGLNVEFVHVDAPTQLKAAFAKLADIRPDALVIVRNLFTIRQAEQITEFAQKNRLPTMYESREFVTSGGLISYGIDYTASWRRAGIYVAKILKGANPATLPVEPPKLELVINLKTAEKIGVKIPPEILLEANDVVK